jgi:hypothetical protein
MSQSPNLAKTELETVVQWRMMAVGGGLAFLVLIVPVVCVLLFSGQHGAPTEQAAAPLRASKHAEIDPALLRSLRPIQPKLDVDEPRKRQPVEDPPAVSSVPTPPPVTAAPEETIAVAASVATPAVESVGDRTPEEEVATVQFKRHNPMSEEKLAYQLRTDIREIDLRAEKDAVAELLNAAMNKAKSTAEPKPEPAPGSPALKEMLGKRADLRGLPMRMGAECKTERKKAAKIQELARTIRTLKAKTSSPRQSQSQIDMTPQMQHDRRLMEIFSSDKADGDTLSAVVQMFQIEGRFPRLEMVKHLAASKAKEASVLLARIALFDLSSEVREAALITLKERPAKEYQKILLDGLRYPWTPVADHAAEALVALKAKEVVPTLVEMLDQPDPCAPVLNKDNKWVTPELVKVNHLRNCLLCHAPSLNKTDPIRGIVPEPGKPMPRVYYDSQKGTFVRADITYLRQDFSVVERVEKPEKWPEQQRYDFVVRMKEVKPKAKNAKEEPASYPQRDAVLFALRELTGKDVGESTGAWKKLLAERGLDRSP